MVARCKWPIFTWSQNDAKYVDTCLCFRQPWQARELRSTWLFLGVTWELPINSFMDPETFIMWNAVDFPCRESMDSMEDAVQTCAVQVDAYKALLDVPAIHLSRKGARTDAHYAAVREILSECKGEVGSWRIHLRAMKKKGPWLPGCLS